LAVENKIFHTVRRRSERDECGVVPPWGFLRLADELWLLVIEPWMRRSDHEAVPADKPCLERITGEYATKDLVAHTLSSLSQKAFELWPAVLIDKLPDTRAKVDLGIFADKILSTWSPTAVD